MNVYHYKSALLYLLLYFVPFDLQSQTDQTHCSFTFPSKLYITERMFSWTQTFDIASDEENLATASRRFFSLSAAYNLISNENGSSLAFCKARFCSWGTVTDVYGEEGLIGILEEEVFRILPWAEYRIFDADHTLIAEAKMNFLGTRFEIRLLGEENEEIYATLSRPFVRVFRDLWTTEIFADTAKIDPRLLIFLAVFQTDKDNRDRYRKQIENELTREIGDFDGCRALNLSQ